VAVSSVYKMERKLELRGTIVVHFYGKMTKDRTTIERREPEEEKSS